MGGMVLGESEVLGSFTQGPPPPSPRAWATVMPPSERTFREWVAYQFPKMPIAEPTPETTPNEIMMGGPTVSLGLSSETHRFPQRWRTAAMRRAFCFDRPTFVS